MGPQARILSGNRLYLQHGPIDLVVGAEGDHAAAFRAAQERFKTVLTELMTEISDLRSPLNSASPKPQGAIAKHMDTACRPFANGRFVTRMAAVAGAVADTVLQAMTVNADITRAYVNNGGDIALYLTANQRFRTAMFGHDGARLGDIEIKDTDPIRGIATSGRHGRSHSLGVADSVTVLAYSAAAADVAATLVANAVDLPNHPNITRQPACQIDDASDLGAEMVVTDCAVLSPSDQQMALAAGLKTAQFFQNDQLIFGAALFLQGASLATDMPQFSRLQRTPEYA
ncbi:MAG: ApbE superfamily uncharacterized protein (UPF0280 family) [Ascidiaceihabitans sp.]|jgi:ApbE superfamily uncharacterized protein (UPF0280 family)